MSSGSDGRGGGGGTQSLQTARKKNGRDDAKPEAANPTAPSAPASTPAPQKPAAASAGEKPAETAPRLSADREADGYSAGKSGIPRGENGDTRGTFGGAAGAKRMAPAERRLSPAGDESAEGKAGQRQVRLRLLIVPSAEAAKAQAPADPK